MTKLVVRGALPVLAAALLAGCPGGGEAEGAGEARIDTTNTQWSDGLSRGQIADSARALSPEEAAAQGLAVDTSIHLEQLGPSDPNRPDAAVPTAQDTARTPVDSAMEKGALDILRTPQKPETRPATPPPGKSPR